MRHAGPVTRTQVTLQLAAAFFYATIYKDDRNQVTDACAAIICQHINTEALPTMKAF